MDIPKSRETCFKSIKYAEKISDGELIKANAYSTIAMGYSLQEGDYEKASFYYNNTKSQN